VKNDPTINHLPTEEARRNSAIDTIIAPHKDEAVTIRQMEEAPKFTSADELPSPEKIIDRLGITDWKNLEKKLVR
jgi:hypothetical protein